MIRYSRLRDKFVVKREKKGKREGEREKGGFLDSRTHCADVLSPTTRCPWIRDRRMEPRDEKKKKGSLARGF